MALRDRRCCYRSVGGRADADASAVDGADADV